MNLQLLYPGGPIYLLSQDYQTTLPISWEACMWVKEQQLEPDMEKLSGSKLGKVWQGCILSSCLFNLYAEYILQNAGLDESQAGMKIARKNNNKPRYANNTTQLAESQEELKSLLIRVK